jgi:hypothetical protein
MHAANLTDLRIDENPFNSNDMYVRPFTIFHVKSLKRLDNRVIDQQERYVRKLHNMMSMDMNSVNNYYNYRLQAEERYGLDPLKDLKMTLKAEQKRAEFLEAEVCNQT